MPDPGSPLAPLIAAVERAQRRLELDGSDLQTSRAEAQLYRELQALLEALADRKPLLSALDSVLGPVMARPERMELAIEGRRGLVNQLLDALLAALLARKEGCGG